MTWVTSEGERYIPDHIRINGKPVRGNTGNKSASKKPKKRAPAKQPTGQTVAQWKERHDDGESFTAISATCEFPDYTIKRWVRRLESL